MSILVDKTKIVCYNRHKEGVADYRRYYMYCSKCGTKTNDNVNFCSKCGNPLNAVSTPGNFDSYQAEAPLKSKNEFISDYYAKHPEKNLYIALSVVSDIIGTIILFNNVQKISEYNSDNENFNIFIFIILALGLWAVGTAFMFAYKNISKQAKKAYDLEIASHNASRKHLYTQNGNTTWKCSRCGKINQHYVGTCGCGEVRPK